MVAFLPIIFVIVSGIVGFVVGVMFDNVGNTNLNENANDNQNLQDLASFINSTSDDRNIVIVVNNLGDRVPVPYNKEMGYGYYDYNYTN